MQMQADAILFDSDGVLVDTCELVERAWRQLASEYDLPIESLLEELAGVRASDTLGRYLDVEQVELAVTRLEDLEVELTPETEVTPGCRPLLESMPGDRWAIVTSASRRLASARWAGARLRTPDVTVTADDVGRGKPHPEPFTTAALRLGAAPQRCLVFEDSESGGSAARAMGAAVCAVGNRPWSFEPVARITDLRAVVVVQRANSLVVTIG